MNPALFAQISMLGLGLFVSLYLYATTIYDGGSKVFPERKSWDWINNFWCDLLWPTTIVGRPNRTYRWGVTANFLLCGSFIFFFLAFAQVYAPSTTWSYVVAIFGTLSMLFAMLIFTPLHDRIMAFIILGGLPAMVGIIYGLVYNNQAAAMTCGTAALVLVAINVYIFYTNNGEKYLPLWQKIAFAAMLSWVCFMNWTML